MSYLFIFFRWLLHFCIEYTTKVSSNGAYSLAIPLRVLEVFTERENTNKILEQNSHMFLENVFTYLIKHGYFHLLRKLIDAKIPPMLEPSSIPPTPISKCLLEMIERPLDLIYHSNPNNDFSMLVLKEMCENLLSPKMTDPIKMFIIPALAELDKFPYIQLVKCINRVSMTPTISLFYSILSLGSNTFGK